MTNERKAFIDKYIKEIISTSNGRCTLNSLLGNSCRDCQLTDSVYNCFNPWYVNILTLQSVADRKDNHYNSSINEILTYISDTYPELFV